VPPNDRIRALLRRLLLLVPLLLVPLLLACSDDMPPPPVFPPLTYDYLPKIRLNVATIDVDNAFATLGTGEREHVEQLAPVSAVDALRQMVHDRLVAAGTSGHAVFVIEDAALVKVPGGFEGTMHVRLDVSTSDGAKSGFAEARVSRVYTTGDTSYDNTRVALYQLVKLMMGDMNVEFEYQVRHELRDYTQSGDGTAPLPPPVQTQDLNTGAAPAAIDLPPPPGTAPPSTAPPGTAPAAAAPPVSVPPVAVPPAPTSGAAKPLSLAPPAQ
jgi:hypothetical protein